MVYFDTNGTWTGQLSRHGYCGQLPRGDLSMKTIYMVVCRRVTYHFLRADLSPFHTLACSFLAFAVTSVLFFPSYYILYLHLLTLLMVLLSRAKSGHLMNLLHFPLFYHQDLTIRTDLEVHQ